MASVGPERCPYCGNAPCPAEWDAATGCPAINPFSFDGECGPHAWPDQDELDEWEACPYCDGAGWLRRDQGLLMECPECGGGG